MNKFKITFAWICDHEEYGEIISFLVSPKVLVCPNTYGYDLSKELDEVFRFPSDHPDALFILKRLARINSTQWSEPSYDLVEEEFDLDDFLKNQSTKITMEEKSYSIHITNVFNH